mmetsp:Transcript_22260/g.44655  ORF Transcript_22260/g.44655 Transcript_22260/m.44655 type:complete len:212 (-) Transcript_22260:239-874(-)
MLAKDNCMNASQVSVMGFTESEETLEPCTNKRELGTSAKFTISWVDNPPCKSYYDRHGNIGTGSLYYVADDVYHCTPGTSLYVMRLVAVTSIMVILVGVGICCCGGFCRKAASGGPATMTEMMALPDESLAELKLTDDAKVTASSRNAFQLASHRALCYIADETGVAESQCAAFGIPEDQEDARVLKSSRNAQALVSHRALDGLAVEIKEM